MFDEIGGNTGGVNNNSDLRSDGDATLLDGGEGVPGSFNSSFDEEMSEEIVVNIGGVGNNSDLRSDANATLTGSLADARGSHTNSVSHQSGYVGSTVENSKLSSYGEGVPRSFNPSIDEVMFDEIVGNTGGVNNNSGLRPDGDAKLLDENSESHCSAKCGSRM
jgi:hypothetical protein